MTIPVTPGSPPYRNIEWDDALEKTPEGTAITTKGLLNVERWLKAKAPTTMLSLSVVEGIHRTVFEDLFPDFAGNIRGPVPPQIPMNVSFGNRRGTPHIDVPSECRRMMGVIERNMSVLDSLHRHTPPNTSFDEEVLKLAAYAHCELIKIHPFVNGNGRIARSCINYFCWRYGFQPLSLARPGGDYLEANRAWMDHRRIDAMVAVLRPNWHRH